MKTFNTEDIKDIMSVQPLKGPIPNTYFHIRIPTETEALEHKKWLNNLHIVRKAIRDKYPPSDKFITDTIACPVCKTGTVHFMISDHYNGHIHAHCTTEDCVSWME